MKKNTLIITGVIILILIVAALFYFLRNFGSEQETFIVSIENFEFGPLFVNINIGESIAWKNEDSVIHDVTMDNGLFDVDINPGENFTYTFNNIGTYEYHCDIHPSMKGTIKVE